MYPDLRSDITPAKACTFASRSVSVFLATTGIWLGCGSPVRAEDTATLQRLEAHIQQMEERH